MKSRVVFSILDFHTEFRFYLAVYWFSSFKINVAQYPLNFITTEIIIDWPSFEVRIALLKKYMLFV